MSESTVSLKEVFANDFPIGAAIDGAMRKRLNEREQALVLRHFNTITAENCLKPQLLQPEEGRFTFDDGDYLVGFARQNGLRMIGHTLVWHNQCPDWFFQDGAKAASRELVLKRLRTHIHTLVGRYKGAIAGWDVVNEAIHDGSEYLRPSKWVAAVGEDFIAHAFRFSQEADPSVELHYNDYNNENPVKREKTLRLLKSLRDSGVRVDAVGMQGHWLLDRIPFKDVEESIEIYALAGYKVMITEMDIDVLPRLCDEEKTVLGLEGPVLAAALQRQAEQYARMFDIFRKHRDKIARVTFWNPHDGQSWLNNWPTKGRTNHPLLFDRDLRAKLAFAAVVGG